MTPAGYHELDLGEPVAVAVAQYVPGVVQSTKVPAGYLARVQATTDRLAALKPWTLERLPGERRYLVADRLTFWMRLRTAWLNIGRRRQAKRLRKQIAAYFSAQQVEARARASQ